MDANRKGTADLGVLVVGVGSIGARRAAAVKAARGLNLVAVADADPSRARAVAAHLDARMVASLDDGLEMARVDAACIVGTPHADHDDIVRASLDAGKHVLCEKPLAIDPAEARDLAEHADQLGLQLATGFNHRFYPPVRDALELVSGWSIGRVESVRMTIGHAASAEFLAGWHGDRAASGGGTMMDNGVHACDLVRKFLGEVAAAKGYVRDALGLPFGIESEAFALFRNHERGLAEVRSSWTLESGYLTIEVRGASGHLKVATGALEADGTPLRRLAARPEIPQRARR